MLKFFLVYCSIVPDGLLVTLRGTLGRQAHYAQVLSSILFNFS